MKKLLAIVMMMLPMLASLNGCKSGEPKIEDKVKETAEAYLYKNMKNPESLKILSCEVRKDTIPFYLVDELMKMADEFNEAVDEYNLYKDRSYLWVDEKIESLAKLQKAKETLKCLWDSYEQNDPIDIEYIAYVKASGTNPMGGTVSNSIIIIIDKDDPTKWLGSFIVDDDFLKRFITLKIVGSDFEFELKQNKFGKFETEGMPYFEQFVMNEVE